MRETAGQHQPADILKMLAHGTAGVFGSIVQNSAHYFIVTIGVFNGEWLDRVGAMALAVNVPHNLLMQCDERAVPGAAHNAEMEVIV